MQKKKENKKPWNKQKSKIPPNKTTEHKEKKNTQQKAKDKTKQKGKDKNLKKKKERIFISFLIN